MATNYVGKIDHFPSCSSHDIRYIERRCRHRDVAVDLVTGSTTVVKVDRRIRWHYTTTVLRLRIGARLTRYRNCKFHNGCRTISRHAERYGISRYSVPPSAGPLLPLVNGSGRVKTQNNCYHDPVPYLLHFLSTPVLGLPYNALRDSP